jgi:hypothetical protein
MPQPVMTVRVEDDEPMLQFSGPRDSDRLLRMMIALIIAGLPLLVDYIRDWPLRVYTKPKYLSQKFQYFLLALLFMLLLYKLDQDFDYVSSAAGPVRYVVDGAGDRVVPALAGAVSGAEQAVWAAEDALFGDGREIVGLLVAAAGAAWLAVTKPVGRQKKGEYSPKLFQGAYLAGALIFGMFIANAAGY